MFTTWNDRLSDHWSEWSRLEREHLERLTGQIRVVADRFEGTSARARENQRIVRRLGKALRIPRRILAGRPPPVPYKRNARRYG